MSDETTTTGVETEQAAREASGAHPYGRYLEEFEVGAVYKHWPAKTVTEADDHLFCLITMNHHPLHINDVYAAQSQQGRNVVVGPLVYSLALGMSVSDVSGQGDRQPRHRGALPPGAGLPRRHAVLRDRGARGQGVALQARPRHGQGPHARAQPGRRARGRVQAPRARARARAPASRSRAPRATSSSRAVARDRQAREADVAVVGAGLAGLDRGTRPDRGRAGAVVVLEARDRVGGRTLNHDIGDGKVVEVGRPVDRADAATGMLALARRARRRDLPDLRRRRERARVATATLQPLPRRDPAHQPARSWPTSRRPQVAARPHGAPRAARRRRGRPAAPQAWDAQTFAHLAARATCATARRARAARARRSRRVWAARSRRTCRCSHVLFYIALRRRLRVADRRPRAARSRTASWAARSSSRCGWPRRWAPSASRSRRPVPADRARRRRRDGGRRRRRGPRAARDRRAPAGAGRPDRLRPAAARAAATSSPSAWPRAR